MSEHRHGRQKASDAAKRRSGNRLGALLPWIVIVVGLFLLVRPIATQWYEAWQASRGIDAITATYDEMSDPERAALREEARLYNAALFAKEDLSQRLPYEEQLVYRGSEMIAYISIPKCSVRLPIYHGTEDKVLMAGVGHLKGTSLPAGGESSHCVLTAHTGMSGRRMFDDIHLLDPGDRFVIWVLGEALAYKVMDSEVIVPEDVSSLVIEQGRDLCTLVTCTPYGINSHRLLVHAERCPYEEGEESMTDLAVYFNGRTAPFIIALVFVLLLVIGIVWRRLRRQREKMRKNDNAQTISGYDKILCEFLKRAGSPMKSRLTTTRSMGTTCMLQRALQALCVALVALLVAPGAALGREAQQKVSAPVVAAFVAQENSNELWQGIVDYPHGVDVPYSLLGTLPDDLANRDTLPYWLVVRFAEGLDYQANSARVYVRHTDESQTDVTSAMEISYDASTRELRAGVDDLRSALPTLLATDRLVLMSQTRLNSKANMGFAQGNVSWGRLEYGGSGYAPSGASSMVPATRLAKSLTARLLARSAQAQSEPLNRTMEMPETVYSYELEVKKVDAETKKPLAGAKFALRDDEGKWYARGHGWTSDQSKATVITTGEDGLAYFEYVDSERYEAVEVEPPKGYVQAKPVDVRITTDVPQGHSASYLDASSVLGDSVAADALSGLVELDIVNRHEEEEIEFPIVPGGNTSQDGTTTTTDSNGERTTTAEGGEDASDEASQGNHPPRPEGRIRQALSQTGDDSSSALPWLITSILCFLCVILLKRVHKKLECL